MSFFEPPPPPPEPPEEHRQPAWIGPPENELGVALPLRRVLFRSDELAIALLGVVAYSSGIELPVAMRRRKMPTEPDPMHFHMRGRHARGPELAPEIFRFGVEYPDGRKATNLGFPFGGPEEPAGPVLMERGGGGGGRSWSFGYWLWPLPPPGPSRVVVEWPVAGVPLTAVELDGAVLAAAAARVDVLWPDDGSSSGSTDSVTSYMG
ncbi:MAG: hypothetical protein ACJ757_06480 [Gaiellaceae bacterium]